MEENENNEQAVQEDTQNVQVQGDEAQATNVATAEATTNVATEATAEAAPTDEISAAFGEHKNFDFKDDKGNVLRTYHFQFPGIEAALKIVELSARSYTEYRKQLLKQIVTDPEVRSKGLEWFDTHKGLIEVTDALDTFLGETLDGVRG